jgi:hypothetical protein
LKGNMAKQENPLVNRTPARKVTKEQFGEELLKGAGLTEDSGVDDHWDAERKPTDAEKARRNLDAGVNNSPERLN